ncbi:MAG: type II toxin-antitoxin system RelE/ParE family toxin [Deltaproteobacteria bacterium]|nr:type II toxin-antitoxin system RelE/ParE family toxin [Deltaproteobacteria bacterium]
MKSGKYRIRVPDHIAALIRDMHPHLKRKVKSALQLILTEPFSGKALKDELEGLMSFRVSKFRIVYRILKKAEIDIVTVGPRQRIYEETLRLLKKED